MLRRSLLCVVLFLSYLVAAAAILEDPSGANGGKAPAAVKHPRARPTNEVVARSAVRMFIHWGLYAVPAERIQRQASERIGEWIMDWAGIPRAEYEKFAPKFQPGQV